MRGALIGCGTRGLRTHLPQAGAQSDLEMVAACDVYKPNLDRALSMIGAAGRKAQGYDDYRRILERKDIDVVFVATPRPLACGDDGGGVRRRQRRLRRKPLANSSEECLAIVDAEKKYQHRYFNPNCNVLPSAAVVTLPKLGLVSVPFWRPGSLR